MNIDKAAPVFEVVPVRYIWEVTRGCLSVTIDDCVMDAEAVLDSLVGDEDV